MSRRRRLGRLSALVCAAAVLLTGCEFSVYKLPLPGGVDLGDDPYAVRIQFRDVLDLVPQSSVKVNDVTVGTVDEIELTGYTAEVTVLLRDDVELPDNALAKIRQTSLLGEKFVSLEPPVEGASSDPLSDDDLIPLERSGRNAEVEEVLGALSLLLNGGGVAQLKTISVELGKALEGRETDVRQVLSRIDTFMGTLDRNKEDIVEAIEKLNRLAVALKGQTETIELTLDELPAALASIDRQRDDLVRMLDALDELSAVGTEVIRQSKEATIESLTKLEPILNKLAEAGDAFPKSLQVFLTYPFVDAVVGRNPAQARNLHMGDYTNLSVQLDLDLSNLLNLGNSAIDLLIQECGQLPAAELTAACEELLSQLPDLNQLCETVDELSGLPICRDPGDDGPVVPGAPDVPGVPDPPDVPGLPGGEEEPELPVPDPGDVLGQGDDGGTPVERCLASGDPDSNVCEGLSGKQRRNLDRKCDKPLNRPNDVCVEANRGEGLLGDGGSGSGGTDEDEGGLLGGGGVLRPAPGVAAFEDRYSLEVTRGVGYDATLGSLLLQGMVRR